MAPRENALYPGRDTGVFSIVISTKGTTAQTPARRKKAFLKALTQNANLIHYPNAGLRAITVGHEDMRGLPSSRTFRSAKKGRSSQPLAFDRLQVSSVPPGTPVYIVHWSRDKKWCLADTGFAFGWLATRNLAFVDDSFIKTWETGSYATFTYDGFPVGKKKHPSFRSTLGSMFPKVGEQNDTLDIYVAVMGKNRPCGHKKVGGAEGGQLSTNPLLLNRQNIATLANELTDNPYGWGGKNRLRDCSSMIRDLYAPFGIWLPRHSADQAKQGGRYIDLSGMNHDEKQGYDHFAGDSLPHLALAQGTYHDIRWDSKQ